MNIRFKPYATSYICDPKSRSSRLATDGIEASHIQTSEQPQDQRRKRKGDQIAAGPIIERASQPGAQRSTDADSDRRIAENRSKSLAGKDIGGERGENDCARAEPNAKKNDVNVK